MPDHLAQDSAGLPAPDPLTVPALVPLADEIPPPAVSEVSVKPNGWRELGEVLWLSLPIIITMLSVTLMSFADVLMVGRHSKAELAAVGPAASVFFLLASLMMGTLSITNTFVAQSVGRGEKREAPSYVWQAIYLSAIWGGVAWLLSPLASGLFRWAGHEAHVQPYEVSYFRWMLLGIAPFGFWLAMSAFYQATKRPVVPMIAGLAGNAFNVVANYALIFGKWGFPEMGIKGAAIATVIATCLQAAIMFALFTTGRTHREYGSRDSMRLDFGKLLRVVRFGLPAGLGWSLQNAGWALFLLKIVGALGEAALAATNATMQIVRVSFMPVIGLNLGVQSIVGHHIGMKDHAGAKRRTYRAIGLAVGFMMTMGLLFLMFRRELIGLFCRGGASENVIAMGSTMLVFAAVCQAFDAIAITSYGALKGAGDTVFPMVVSVVCCWLIFIPLALFFVFTLDMGVAGAWLAITINTVLVSAVNFSRFASGAWKKIDMFKGQQCKGGQGPQG